MIQEVLKELGQLEKRIGKVESRGNSGFHVISEAEIPISGHSSMVLFTYDTGRMLYWDKDNSEWVEKVGGGTVSASGGSGAISGDYYTKPQVDSLFSAHTNNTDAHHNQQHAFDGPDHLVSGLTAGEVLIAISPTDFEWGQLQHNQLGGITPDQHHARQHDIVSASDHTATGSQYSVVGLSATDTLGILDTDFDGTVANTILRSNGDGRIRLSGLLTNFIISEAGDISIVAADDIRLNATGNDIIVESDATLRSADWVSGTTGWGISYSGIGDFRELFADALTVETFIADVNLALAGSQIIPKSMAEIAEDLTLSDPLNPGDTFTLTVYDLPTQEGIQVFEENDWVRLRFFDRSGGGLLVGDAWGTVTGNPTPANGVQSWTFTFQGGHTNVAGQTIRAGMVALDYGQSGDGYWHVTTLQAFSPYAEIATWQTDPSIPANFTVHSRFGQLQGITSVDEWGIWAGNQADNKYIKATNLGVTIENADLNVIDGNVYFGDDANTQYVSWNGTSLIIRGQLLLPGGDPVLGPGLTWRGTWAVSTPYAKYDAVNYNGSSYIALVAHTSAASGTDGPPPGARWSLVAEEGDQGPQGEQGEQGPQGPQGEQGIPGIDNQDFPFLESLDDDIIPGYLGLMMTSERMGYVDFTGVNPIWYTYMDNDGNFYFGNPSAGSHLAWSVTTGKLGGFNNTGDTQWWADANDGNFYAADGAVTINEDGIGLDLENFSAIVPPPTWYTIGKSVTWGDMVSVHGYSLQATGGNNPIYGTFGVTVRDDDGLGGISESTIKFNAADGFVIDTQFILYGTLYSRDISVNSGYSLTAPTVKISGLLEPVTASAVDLGTVAKPLRKVYVDEIVAGAITGGDSLGGQIWTHSADMYIQPNSAGDTTVHIANPGEGDVVLYVYGDISVDGTVDGVDVAALYSSFSVHNHNDLYYTESEINSWRSGHLVPDAHHDPVTAGAGIDLSGQQVSVDVTDFIDTAYGLNENGNNIRVNLSATGGLEFSSGAIKLKLRTNHALLLDSSGLGVDPHTGLSVSASGIGVNESYAFDWGGIHTFGPAPVFEQGLYVQAAGYQIVFNTDSATRTLINVDKSPLGSTGSVVGRLYWTDDDRFRFTPDVLFDSNIEMVNTKRIGTGLGTAGEYSISFVETIDSLAGMHLLSDDRIVFTETDTNTAKGFMSLNLGTFDWFGAFTAGSITSDGDLYAGNTGFRVISHTHDNDHVHVVVNPTAGWSLDEQFGVDIDDNLLVRGYIVGKHAIQISDASLIAHFDGPEPYWSNVDGTATGHLGQVPEYVGTKSFKSGKFGKALAVSRPSTNYIVNSCFRDVYGDFLTSNWTNWGGSTFSDGGVDNRFFGRILRAISDGSGAEIHAHVPQVARQTTGTYYFSFWARANESRTVRAQLKLSGSPYTVDDYEDISLTTEWQHFSVALTNTSGNDAIRPFLSNWSNQDNGDWIEIAEVQFELGQQTAYFNGSFGEYFAWDGADWETASHRNNRQTVLYRNMDQFADVNRGSIMLWIYSLPTGDNDAFFIGNGAESDSRLRIRHYASETAYMQIGDSGAISMGSMPYRQWNHVAITWESDGGSGGTGIANAYVNGIQVVTNYAYDNMNSFEDRVLYVGRLYSSSTYTANGYVDDLVIVRRAMTGDEIRAIYESNAPVFAETSTFQWRAGRNRVWADAEGLWAFGASGTAILGLYAGDDNNPAATKSWGGFNLAEGDLLIGNTTDGFMYYDRDLKLYLSGVDIYIDDASGRAVQIDRNSGINLTAYETDEPLDYQRGIHWWDDASVQSGDPLYGIETMKYPGWVVHRQTLQIQEPADEAKIQLKIGTVHNPDVATLLLEADDTGDYGSAGLMADNIAYVATNNYGFYARDSLSRAEIYAFNGVKLIANATSVRVYENFYTGGSGLYTESGHLFTDGGLIYLNGGTVWDAKSVVFNNTENSSHSDTAGTVYYDQNVTDADFGSSGKINGSSRGGLGLYNGDDGWGLIFDTNNMDAINAEFNRVTTAGYMLAGEGQDHEVYLGTSGFTGEVVIKNNLLSGGWARGFRIENDDFSTYIDFGYFGSGQTGTYGYIGKVYNNTWLRFYGDSPSYMLATVDLDMNGNDILDGGLINASPFITVQHSTTDRYGYIELENSAGVRGAYLGYGSVAEGHVDLYLEDADYFWIRAGDVRISANNSIGNMDSGSISKIVFGSASLDFYSDDAIKFYESDNNVLRATWSMNTGDFSFLGNLDVSGTLGTGTTALTLGSGWSNYGGSYGAARYKKIGDIVIVTGMVQSVSGRSNDLGFLPAGYRPSNRLIFDIRSVSGSTRLDVEADGTINISSGGLPDVVTWLSLDGIIFSTL